MAKIYQFPDPQRGHRKSSRLRRRASDVTAITEDTLESFIQFVENEEIHKAGMALAALMGLAPNIGIHAAVELSRLRSENPDIWGEFVDILKDSGRKRAINDVLFFFGKYLRLDGIDSINAYLYLRDHGPKTMGS